MAQSEDTELRDLVIESLEKNGSLAKVRALLRANVFLAFEDECENLKQNESLDKILKLPEGKISLCIIHEFLEFCNLKNTLFVYTAETRQGKEYKYENVTAEKLNVPKLGSDKEPVLITILKDCMKRCLKLKKGSVKDDENCTYIVNEDTSTTSSQSLSDSSSDEKNKIDLRLTLHTNSDTDTSSDSVKDKSKSEYIPNQQYYPQEVKIDDKNISQGGSRLTTQQPLSNTYNIHNKSDKIISNESKFFNNSSTESTSYMELKPLNALDEVLHNTSGLPDESEYLSKPFMQPALSGSQNDSISSMKGLSSNSEEVNKNSIYDTPKSYKNKSDEQGKDTDTMEYSYDFSPQNSELKNISDKNESLESLHIKSEKKSDQQHSPSSHSSVSLSDVADLISEKNNSPNYKSKTDDSVKSKESSKSNKHLNKEQVKSGISDDSGDFTESSIPSLSNLSFDIHSE